MASATDTSTHPEIQRHLAHEQEMLDGIARRLRTVRVAHGYPSAAALAHHLRLPASTIKRAERGQLRSAWSLTMLARALLKRLEVSTDWLLKGDPRFAPDPLS